MVYSQKQLKGFPAALRLLVFVGCVLGMLWVGGSRAVAQKMPVTRALLVACESFVTQESLAPSASASVNELVRVLARNENMLALHTEIGTLSTARQLGRAIRETFADATEDDVSFFYIATHGNYRPEIADAQATLSLSDGKVETTFAAATLGEMLDKVPGTKIVLIDACNSGALIGKGMDLSKQAMVIGQNREDYKILTSAGGNELSWHYTEPGSEQSGLLRVGSSYFSAALAAGLGKDGSYPADLNQDGTITWDELYRYMLANHATSTVQVTPQRDDFVFLSYDPEDTHASNAPVTDIRFENETLSFDQPSLVFALTVQRPVQLEYHITYFREGKWDWENTVRSSDTFDPGGAGPVLTPGRRQRSIQMPDIAPDTAGYALFQIMVIENNVRSLATSRLISVMPKEGDPQLTLQVPATTFSPLPGNEMAIYVQHLFPLRLSMEIYDLAGNLVCRVADNQLTRPLLLEPEGSVYYWDGKDQYGNPVEAGVYSASVTGRAGERVFEAQPLLFQVNR